MEQKSEQAYLISVESSERLNILKMLLAIFVVVGHAIFGDLGMDGEIYPLVA